MIDHLIFYTILNQQIYFLLGKLRHNEKYNIINYRYTDPFDDSSIVELFKRDYQSTLINPNQLLTIINKTVYPNFMKLNTNGLIYLIKVNHINHPNSYLANPDSIWQQLIWININNNLDIRNQLEIKDRTLLDKFKIIPFIKNQYKVNYNLYSLKDLSFINQLMIKKKNKKTHKIILDQQLINYNQTILAHFKNYQYTQMLSLYNYTTYCQTLNQTLRSILDGSKIPNIPIELITNALNIIDIINQAPLYSQFDTHYLSLYRGISYDPHLNVGHVTDVFTNSLISTSLNVYIPSNSFVGANGSLFKLIIPSDLPMLPTKHISHHPYEDEILLLPGNTFRIIDKGWFFNDDLKINQVYYTMVLQKNSDIQSIKSIIQSYVR